VSLAELLPAIRALPKAERVELLHLLIDGVAETPSKLLGPGDDGISDELRKLLPPPGSVIEYWDVTTDAAGWAAIGKLLAELKETP
jgi:hypothetical protein